jgi:DNA helicase-2/ATP-dependent DNA helicase PcrA
MLHGQIRYGIPSRFLDEIPDELLKRINSRQAQKPSMSNSNEINRQNLQPSISSEQRSAMPWKIGQAVSHAKFGQGIVVSYEGNTSDMRIQINFGREGLKWLAMEYAKLEKI